MNVTDVFGWPLGASLVRVWLFFLVLVSTQRLNAWNEVQKPAQDNAQKLIQELEEKAKKSQALDCFKLRTILPPLEIVDTKHTEGTKDNKDINDNENIRGNEEADPERAAELAVERAAQHDLNEQFRHFLCETETAKLRQQAEEMVTLIASIPDYRAPVGLIYLLQVDIVKVKEAGLYGPDQRARVLLLEGLLNRIAVP